VTGTLIVVLELAPVSDLVLGEAARKGAVHNRELLKDEHIAERVGESPGECEKGDG